MDQFSWRTAAKMATRETRASAFKFAFVVLAVAVGVGALTGVRGFSQAFHGMLLKEARTLMAADLTVRTFSLPTPVQQATLDRLAQTGAQRTQITETVSMAASHSGTPLLVSVKAVDPRAYPYYGAVKLDPPGPLNEVLTANSVAVSPELLIRLQVKLGDTVRVGGQEFRIGAVDNGEPDRMSGSLNVGPRLLMSRAGLERTGLIRFGSRAPQRFLFKLPANGLEVQDAKTQLQRVFPEAQVIDYRESNPAITRGLERATTFLSLISLIALIVGALGVAMAIYSHLQQRLDTIAILKSLGARSSQIVRIYVLQTMLLGLAGGIGGVLVGLGIQAAFPLLIRRYFALQPALTLDPWAVLQGLAVGMLTTLLFTLPPLLSIRRIRPGLILRREMEDAQPTWRERLQRGRSSAAVGLLIVAGIAGVAAWLAESPRMGGYFVAGLLASLLALAVVAWLLLRGLRTLLRWSPLRLPATLRHGLANLYRPGNQAQPVLVALGVGVMFTLTIFLLQQSVLTDLRQTAPPGLPNVYLLDITPEQRDPVMALIRQQPGVERGIEIIPSVSARLTKVNGVALDQLGLKGWGRRFLQTRSVTWSSKLPESTLIRSGKFWPGDSAEPLVSVNEDAARLLRLQPGSVLEAVAGGRPIRARVAALHRTEATRVNAINEFIFTPVVLRDLPTIYYGGLRARAADVPALQRVLYDRYPTVTVVNVADVLQTIQEVVDQIALVVRFLSLFAILAGVIILAASIAGTRLRRVREVVILKTLGGTRRRVAAIFSVEFLLLGTVAGIMGSLLAVGFTSLVLRRLLQGELTTVLLPCIVAVLLTALVANLAGWLASFRLLGQKPLEVLREA